MYLREDEDRVKGKEIDLRYTCSLLWNEKLYFSAADYNGLFQMDLEDFSVKLLTSFYGYPMDSSYMHLTIIPYKSKLVFFPLNGKTIDFYEPETGAQQQVEIPMKVNKEISDKYHGQYVAVRGRKAWLFSREAFRGVFEFDMEDGSINKSKKLSELMMKYRHITNFIETSEMQLFTYSPDVSALIEIDLEKETVEEHSINMCDIKIASINYFLGKFWFIDGDLGDIYECDRKEESVKRFVADHVERIADAGAPFDQCQLINGKIYVIPGQSKHIKELDRETGVITNVGDYPEDFRFLTELEIGAFSKYDVIGDKIWLHPCKGNRLLILDMVSKRMESRVISTDLYKILDEHDLFHDGVVKESEMLSLAYLCQAKWKRQPCNVVSALNQVGKEIYKKMSQYKEEVGNG